MWGGGGGGGVLSRFYKFLYFCWAVFLCVRARFHEAWIPVCGGVGVGGCGAVCGGGGYIDRQTSFIYRYLLFTELL